MQNRLKSIRIWGLAAGLLFSGTGWGQGVANPSGGTVTQIQGSEGAQEKERQQDAKRAQKPAVNLSEAEALDLAKMIQSTDAQAGKLGQEKGKQASVTTLAQQLEKDHKELELALMNFEKRTKLSPQSSPMKDSMAKTWQERIEKLKQAKKGAEFDRAFVEHEIQFHQEALQLLQTGLKGGAKDPEFRKILDKAESSLKSNLQRAQYVQRSYDNEGIHY